MMFQGIGIGEGRVRDGTGSGVEVLHNNDDDSRTLDNGAGRKSVITPIIPISDFLFCFSKPDYKREPIVSTLKGAPLRVDYPNDAES
jgi:hypothetical protein